MREIGVKDENLVVIVGDISHGILGNFRNEFPSRYFNIGISEPAMVNIGAGLSAQGLIPVIHTISPFLIERCVEQIKLDYAYQEFGVNLVSVGGAFEYSKLGCSHHCYTDFQILSQFSNANIFFPASSEEFEILFTQNYNHAKINYFRLTEYPHEFSFHASQIMTGEPINVSEGDNLTIVVVGSSLKETLKAQKKLNDSKLSADIFYLHTLKPLNLTKIEKSLRRTKKLLVVAQVSTHGGLYASLMTSFSGRFIFESSSIEIQDFIRDYGDWETILIASGFDENNIYKSAIKLVNGN
jgi:transketolase